MLVWVLNMSLLFEDSSNVLFFQSIYIVRLLIFVTFLKYFTSFNSSNMLLKYLVIKPFNLLNTVPLSRTKPLVSNLLIFNEQFLMKEQPRT